MDLMTALLLAAVAWMGFSYNMVWLAVIAGALLLAYLFGTRGKPKPVSSGKPKVRPIIVQRRYDGPKSIYPEKMSIKMNPSWNTMAWWENALGAAGTTAGMIAQGFKPKSRGAFD